MSPMQSLEYPACPSSGNSPSFANFAIAPGWLNCIPNQMLGEISVRRLPANFLNGSYHTYGEGGSDGYRLCFGDKVIHKPNSVQTLGPNSGCHQSYNGGW
jgi:hypothetical protein